MAKKKATSSGAQVVQTYVYGPLSKAYYIRHEVTVDGGVIYQLALGSSNDVNAFNLAPGHKYAVVRVDHGVHSTLTVHKMRHVVLTDPKRDDRAGKTKNGIEDPPIFSECSCSPNSNIVNPCPPGSTMVCVNNVTSCQVRDPKDKKKKASK